ncbi:MAG: TIM-barrel domain-containing protein [Chloroherpetonaceae bacterium]
MKLSSLFILIHFSFSLHAQTYFETQGVVSIEAENIKSRQGFSLKRQYTGEGLKSDSSYSAFEVEIEFSQAGNYDVWILGRAEKPASRKASIRLANQTADLDFGAHFSLIWQKATRPLPISRIGKHRLSVQTAQQQGLLIDKLILIRNGFTQPSGIGFSETSSRTATPIQTGFDSSLVLPPHWAFGVLYGGYTNQQESESTVQRLIDEGYPIDAYWIDSWFWDYQTKGKGPKGYLDFIGDTLAFPNIESMWKKFESLNVKAGIWVWNTILKDSNEAAFNDFESRGLFASVYLNKDRWHNKDGNSLTGDIDFAKPDAAQLWKEKLKPFFDKGLDFLKLDREADLSYLKASFEATAELGKETKGRGFILSHLMHSDNPEFKKYPTKWTGDAKIAWTQPDFPDFSQYAMGGYKENIDMIANPRRTTYEIPFLAHDAGGYDFFGTTDTLAHWDELYIRWIQFASFSPIMTVFSTAKNPRRNHPYLFSKEAQESFKYYAALRLRLFPYRYTLALNARLNGTRMISSLPETPHQFLLGRDLFIAPVLEKSATSMLVHLPDGRWIDFYSEKIYDGNQTIRVQTPLSQIPLFIRKGAILPTRNLARNIELGSNDTLTLDIYPDGHSSFTLLEDDGKSNDYLNGGIGKTVVSYSEQEHLLTIEPMQGKFEGCPKARFLNVKIHFIREVKRISHNGNTLSDFTLENGRLHVPMIISTQERNELRWE